MKLKDRLDLLKRAAPECSIYGQLYKNASDTKGAWYRVTLHCVFVSSENTHAIREHIFETKKDARTAQEWSDWFGRNLEKIHRDGVLPGMSLRTGKQWAVAKIIGWTADANDKASDPKVSKRRPKAKRKGRKNG